MKKVAVAFHTAALVLALLGVAGCGTSHPTSLSNHTSSANSSTPTAFPVTLKDDAGHTVTVAKRPERIASTTEGTDEILSGLVPKKNIVLVTTYSNDPSYSNITSFVKGIPTIQGADAEQIIAAHPDLVLMASYTNQNVVSQIEQAHIPAYEFNNFNSIGDIERNIEVVGTLVGNESGADKMVRDMETQIQAIQNKVKGQKKVRVLNYSSYGYVAGSSTTVNDVIVDAGGVNAAANLKGWQKVSDEEVVKLSPDVIIVASDDHGFIQRILANPALKTVPAVKNHRVYSINSAHLTSVSQYVVLGVQDVAKALYPNVDFAP
ncbi:ABC transporter substrate-binding protein [Alicyclobacillus macrosporangiidus]|uniref:Iron complex transport system substrate-binding protein n=1 Tax=Alicyclobacillus macrosporangiidus TaxID=392015 RepID=A0A1I7JGU8_9BACL|nr:ABC transporter substrate-binding protein [Alicyclobacillus macrosporangiidus]SFU84394.1 iron complex transport system substrate-binding protein [Alicyclobacillus macrosporangiidus]